jgi:hypothetical protein
MIICHYVPRAGDAVYNACQHCGHVLQMHSVIDVRPCAVCALEAAAARMADAVLPVLAAGVHQQTQMIREGAHTPARGFPAHRFEVEPGPIPGTDRATTVYRIGGYRVNEATFTRVANGGTFVPETDALYYEDDRATQDPQFAAEQFDRTVAGP